jgi:hypothetical protein
MQTKQINRIEKLKEISNTNITNELGGGGGG